MTIKKTVRLNKVLRELNISLDKAVEFLLESGHKIEVRPTAKIDEKTYYLLCNKFRNNNSKQGINISFNDFSESVNNFRKTKNLGHSTSPITNSKIITEIRDEKGIPKSIFKYYSVNDFSFDSLKKKYLYFSKPTDFNDPFDCSTNLISFINENSKNKTRHKRKEKTFAEKLNHIGICCFSRLNDSILMWSHYASSHKGYCVEYKTNIRENGINPLDVNYISIFKKSNYFDKATESIVHLIYSKSSEWSYENELRSLKTHLKGDKERKIKYQDTDIQAIYFGINIEEKTKNQIIKIVFENYESEIKFYQADKASSDFRIKWTEIKY